MFGLIGHLTKLEHAQSAANAHGYTEYGSQGIDFWCSAPPQIVENFHVTSVTGQIIEGKYVESFFLPEMIANRRIKTAIRKILNAMALAQKANLKITALGGFSSIIFENFNLKNNRQVRNVELEFERFTTGNTHTAYIICRQVEQVSAQLGIDLSKATIAVCGATGDIGSGVCRWLEQKNDVAELLLIARNQERLNNLCSELGRGKIMNLQEALPKADIIVCVASMHKGVEMNSTILKKPCLLIDGGYPKNLSTKINHPDIHVLNGGIVEHSLNIDWKIMETANMNTPSHQMFACFAEAMLLEFEKWHTNFSWGRNQITVEKMTKIGEASIKHGFKPLLTVDGQVLRSSNCR